MPPYKAPVSKAQRREFFHLAEIGQMSMADARGKARAAKGKHLPEHVGPVRKHMQSLSSYGDMSHAHTHPSRNLGPHLKPRKPR